MILLPFRCPRPPGGMQLRQVITFRCLPNPLHRKRGGIPGASGTRRGRRPPLPLHSGLARMGRRGSHSPHRSGSSSWRHGSHRRGCTRCGTRVVGPHPESCEEPSRQCRASPASRRPPAWPRLDGDGWAGSSVGLPSTWSAALGVPKAPGGSSPPSPAGLLFSVSWHRLLGPLQRAAALPPLAPGPAWGKGVSPRPCANDG
jgi:hypothetical protein